MSKDIKGIISQLSGFLCHQLSVLKVPQDMCEESVKCVDVTGSFCPGTDGRAVNPAEAQLQPLHSHPKH